MSNPDFENLNNKPEDEFNQVKHSVKRKQRERFVRKKRKKIGALKSHIYRDCAQSERNGVKSAQRRKRSKKRHRIFAARYADSNFIARSDHIIIFDSTSGKA